MSIIHSSTRNRSFLKMYKTLQELGVKNNKFFLRLYDADLANVNPHDKNLSSVIKKKIVVEIVRNPWYYLREVILLPAAGSSIPFELHRGNLALVWCILNNLNTILILPRQQGKTIGVVSILEWVYDFGTSNTEILFSNKSLGDAINNLKRLKDIRHQLPAFLKEAITNTSEDVDNIEGILCADRNNSIKTKGQPRSAVDADKQGRGMTAPFLWFDEFAFLTYNDLVLKAASPAYSKAAANAEKSNKPYGKLITTTPNNIDSGSGMVCYQIINEAAKFDEMMYDWSKEEIKDYIKNNSSNDYIFIEFTWKQLGLSEEWYEEQKRSLLNDSRTIEREVDIQWTKSSDNSVFDEDQLNSVSFYNEKINTDAVKLIQLDASDRKDGLTGKVDTKFFLKAYKDLDPTKRYFIGVDTGGGVNRDPSAFVIVEPHSLKPVAVFRNNKINVSLYTTLLENLVTDILPNSILFIERNSLGKGVVDLLVRRCHEKIFYDYKLSDKSKSKVFTNSKNIVYGIDNTPNSRSKMLDILSEIVENKPYNLSLPELYSELKTLSYTKSGKIEHAAGCHDDVIFAYLLVCYAVSYSNTIRKFLNGSSNKQMKINSSNLLNKPYLEMSDVNDTMHIPEDIEEVKLSEIIDDLKDSVPLMTIFAHKQTDLQDTKKKINENTVDLLFNYGNKK